MLLGCRFVSDVPLPQRHLLKGCLSSTELTCQLRQTSVGTLGGAAASEFSALLRRLPLCQHRTVLIRVQKRALVSLRLALLLHPAFLRCFKHSGSFEFIHIYDNLVCALGF